MQTAIVITAALVLVALLYVVVPTATAAFLRFRGRRIVTCPETRRTVGVDVDARKAALGALIGNPKLRLRDCTRWPERSDCGQECLAQIDAAPEACLVRTILTQWYAGKSCGLCGKDLSSLTWAEHKPALMSVERRMLAWNEVPVQRLADVLAVHLPICWSCFIAERFRSEHPELVVDRPNHAAAPLVH